MSHVISPGLNEAIGRAASESCWRLKASMAPVNLTDEANALMADLLEQAATVPNLLVRSASGG